MPFWLTGMHPDASVVHFAKVSMKLSGISLSLQASVLASAALLMLPAGAQTQAPETPAAAVAPAAQSTPATPRLQIHQSQQQRAQRNAPVPRHSNRTGSGGEPPNLDRLASDRGATAADYERNAMARCEAFKTDEQRKACRERTRQTPDGSVQGGGVLREYSYEVPADGS